MVKGPQLQRVYTWINGLLSDPAPQLISVEDIGAVSGLLCAAFCFLYCAGRRSCFPVIVWLLLSLSLSPPCRSLSFSQLEYSAWLGAVDSGAQCSPAA